MEIFSPMSTCFWCKDSIFTNLVSLHAKHHITYTFGLGIIQITFSPFSKSNPKQITHNWVPTYKCKRVTLSWHYLLRSRYWKSVRLPLHFYSFREAKDSFFFAKLHPKEIEIWSSNPTLLQVWHWMRKSRKSSF